MRGDLNVPLVADARSGLSGGCVPHVTIVAASFATVNIDTALGVTDQSPGMSIEIALVVDGKTTMNCTRTALATLLLWMT